MLFDSENIVYMEFGHCDLNLRYCFFYIFPKSSDAKCEKMSPIPQVFFFFLGTAFEGLDVFCCIQKSLSRGESFSSSSSSASSSERSSGSSKVSCKPLHNT